MAEPTLADYAELWCKDRDGPVPERETPEWMQMYERWIDYAFQGDDPPVRKRAAESVVPRD